MINSHESSGKSKSVFTEVYTQKRGTCVTVVILGVIIGIFALAYITFGNESLTNSQRINSTLKLVSILIHHGQSAPKVSYPNDVFSNDTRWLLGLGELSKKGKQNMYNLGKLLRERYSGFLPELYYSSDIQVLSSYTDTCLMSASVLLAGLYPPHKFQIWNPHILWQPIPVKGLSVEIDKMIDVTKRCPALQKMRKKIEFDHVHNDPDLPKFLDYLSENTGMEVQNLSSILALHNLLDAQNKSNLPLPEWAQLVFPQKMSEYAIKALQVDTENINIVKLSTGVIIEKILFDMMKKNSNELLTKMVLYSTQERSIANILRVLNRNWTDSARIKPDFSASVIIELHTISNETVVKAYYLEKMGKSMAIVNVTECGVPCSLAKFIKFIGKFIPHNWENECLT